MAASSDSSVPSISVENVEKEDSTKDSKSTSSTVTAGRRREKVPLAPGHTLAHWNALVVSRKKSYPTAKITVKQLSEHKSQDDAWVSLNGKVFDVTKYMDFHPGGVQKLLLVAGKDATSMFQKYHAWVNYESLLAADCVGYLVPDDDMV